MKTIALIAAATLLVSANAFAEERPTCNPAIQNWENGSRDTCIFNSPNTPIAHQQEQRFREVIIRDDIAPYNE